MYLISMDLRRYQTLETDQLLATLAIDENGAVLQATFEPKLPAVLDHQLGNDAGTWLFLPVVKDGLPRPATVTLPLKLR